MRLTETPALLVRAKLTISMLKAENCSLAVPESWMVTLEGAAGGGGVTVGGIDPQPANKPAATATARNRDMNEEYGRRLRCRNGAANFKSWENRKRMDTAEMLNTEDIGPPSNPVVWIAPVKPQGAILIIRGLALDHSTIDAYAFLIYRVTPRGNPVKTLVRNQRNPRKVWAGGVRPLPRIPAASYKTNLVPTRFQMRGGCWGRRARLRRRRSASLRCTWGGDASAEMAGRADVA